jgi:hypothetical protein
VIHILYEVHNNLSYLFVFVQSASILEPHELTELTQKEERTVAPPYGAATVAEIDCTVKKYTDNLLRALEGVSVRLSRLENRAHHIESSMDDLNLVVGNYAGNTDRKLLQFENILREVSSLQSFYSLYFVFSCCCVFLMLQASNHTDQFSFDMNPTNPSKIE